jgi:hypothetical protein
MPKTSVVCVILAWLVALAGATTGVALLWSGHLNGMVVTVVLTLVVSIALVTCAVRKDPRCDGFYETNGFDLAELI